MRTRLSASKLGLARHCLAWANPEWQYKEPPVSRAANAGTRMHALIDNYLSFKSLAGYSSLNGSELHALSAWRAWYIEQYQRFPIRRSEVRYALDTDWLTARELPPPEYHRDYRDVKPTEVPGSADAESVHDGVVHIYDWKHSSKPQSWNAQTTAEGNAQLEFLAACAASVRGVKSAVIHIVHITPTNCYEAPEGGVALDEWRLEETREEVRDMVRRLPLAEANPGPWCTRQWCPAKKECKAYLDMKGAT